MRLPNTRMQRTCRTRLRAVRSLRALGAVRQAAFNAPPIAHKPTGRRMPRLILFGATGSLGSHVLRQALAAGHQVTALVRTPSSCHRSPRLECPCTAATSASSLR